MWTFTQDGFISTVQDRDDSTVLIARSRDRQSLELISTITGAEIVTSDGTDYGYRVRVTREQFAEFLVANVYALDYPNFKNRIYETRGHEWHEAAAGVWSEMLAVTDKEARENRYGICR